MATYLLIDTMNMANRAKHVTHGSIDDKVGMSMHIMFQSVRKVWNAFNGDHLIFGLEGRSWRKDFYKPYKKNREVAKMAKTQREREDDEIFFEGINEFCKFLDEKTNASVIKAPNAEADDVIAHWIEMHPNDDHIIISSDTDYYQLLAPNVKMYNGITEETITIEGFFDSKGKPVIDKKTKQPKEVPDPEWLLFEKCIRGDKSDNIFSAYPGVRKKGTKNKIGMLEAYADRHTKGFAWNNFMLTKWVDHEEKEQRVKDCYERNVKLVDLTAQPDEIKAELDAAFDEAIHKEPVRNVGIHFMKFCGMWNLVEISKYPTEYANLLNARYKP